MRRLTIALPALLGACGANPAPANGAQPAPIAAETRQLVVVTVDGWEDASGELERFERGPGGGWKGVGQGWPAAIGGGGSAWGRGLHGHGPPAGRAGPVKQEGDGKSPAGAFALGRAFGYEAAPPLGTRVPYVQVDESWVCVDDARSAHYNAVLDRDGVAIDWSSFEEMRRADELYRWVLLVDHNPGAAPGAGSCIFLHLWSGPDSRTAGCTAMERADMETLLSWLDPAAHPVFVLLPAAEAAALRAPWVLP